jgi:hypothetical protein
MPRRHTRAGLTLAFAPLLLALVGACQAALPSPSPTPPPLTDPKEILTKSVATLANVKTFHVDADLSGKVTANLGGTTSGAGQLDLAGTKGALDVDVTNKKVHATGSMPALLNSAAEAIVLPDALYYKISGPLSQGDKFSKLPIPSAATASDSPADPQQAIGQLNESLAKLPQAPTKLADAKCGDTDCYDVQIKLTAADVQALSPSAAPSGFTNGVITLDVLSRKSDLRPARFVAVLSSAELGSLTLALNVTYDVAINVVAPPADQVTDVPGIAIPSLTP